MDMEHTINGEKRQVVLNFFLRIQTTHVREMCGLVEEEYDVVHLICRKPLMTSVQVD